MTRKTRRRSNSGTSARKKSRHRTNRERIKNTPKNNRKQGFRRSDR